MAAGLDTKRKLAQMTRKFMRAVQERDMDFLDRSLGDEFVLTTGRSGHETRSRAEWLEVTADTYEIDEFDFDELEVLRYGHVGVVRSRYRQTARMDGADRSDTYLMTDVWVRRKGRWVMVTRHITPLGETAASA